MIFKSLLPKSPMLGTVAILACLPFVQLASGQQVTFPPYIQPGDNGPFGPTDQIVIAWQTNETTPGGGYQVNLGTTTSYGSSVTPSVRVVDTSLPIPHWR